MMDPEIERKGRLLSINHDDSDDSDEENATESFIFRKRINSRWPQLLFAPLIISNALTFVFTNWSWKKNFDGLCSLHTSQSWSPVFDDVEIKYQTLTFNGTFFKDTIYRQPPSPEVDQAWRDLGIEYTGILIPPSQAEKANIASDRVMLDETYGGPGYPAVFEVLHQLHCVDLLRKSSYFNAPYYLDLGVGPFKDPEKQLKPHIGHCLENIRQQLMCTADTGLHPFIWAGNPPHVFPDFNREHKCKNFEAIREWAEKNQGTFGELDIVPREGELVLDEVP